MWQLWLYLSLGNVLIYDKVYIYIMDQPIFMQGDQDDELCYGKAEIQSLVPTCYGKTITLVPME